MPQLKSQFSAVLSSDAAALARTHEEPLARLPLTIQAFVLAELQKWPLLFAPERRYQRALLEYLSGTSAPEVLAAGTAIARVETQAGCDAIGRGDPARFQDEAQALLRKQKLLQAWRKEVDTLFQHINPALEAALYPADGPRRLVVQLYGSGIAIGANPLWSRFKGIGLRVPLALGSARDSDAFLRTLFGGAAGRTDEPALLASMRASEQLNPHDVWIVESHRAIHDLCGRTAATPPGNRLTGLSYDLLRQYREELMRALYAKVVSGVENPQAFAAYARSLTIAPGTDALLDSTDIVQAFVRDVFLTGNGTLFVNNTFVEWAAVQALRRAQPRVLVTRFGVRHKFRPFSSMLLFSQPRASDSAPAVEDPAGSFIDVEQLSYYIWVNAQKSPAYRTHTLYLFLAEGASEMLAVRSDLPPAAQSSSTPATLAEVSATMAHWLGLPAPDASARPIAALAV